MAQSEKVNRIVMTALMMGMITAATMFIKIMVPMTQEYVHLGDAMIFLAVLILGWKYGAVAAAVGAAMGDILGGFAMWAPWTFFIKAAMAIAMGLFLSAFGKKGRFNLTGFPLLPMIGMTIAGLIMTGGYYLVSGLMYGNWIAALAGVPFNIGQFIVGMIIAVLLTAALCKTAAKKYFFYVEARL